MARSILSRVTRSARRRRPNQAAAAELKLPKEGETRDNVTYGKTFTLGAETETKSSKTASEPKS